MIHDMNYQSYPIFIQDKTCSPLLGSLKNPDPIYGFYPVVWTWKSSYLNPWRIQKNPDIFTCRLEVYFLTIIQTSAIQMIPPYRNRKNVEDYEAKDHNLDVTEFILFSLHFKGLLWIWSLQKIMTWLKLWKFWTRHEKKLLLAENGCIPKKTRQ